MKEVKYVICNFNTVDSNRGRKFNRKSVEDLLSNEEFRSKLDKKTLIGSLTHRSRDKYMGYLKSTSNPRNLSTTNPSDFLFSEDEACNVLTDLKIEGDNLIATLLILPTSKGLLVEKLLDLGMDFQVSMSTELTMDREFYYLKDLFGIDFTLKPAFPTSRIDMKEVN